MPDCFINGKVASSNGPPYLAKISMASPKYRPQPVTAQSQSAFEINVKAQLPIPVV